MRFARLTTMAIQALVAPPLATGPQPAPAVRTSTGEVAPTPCGRGDLPSHGRQALQTAERA